MKAFYVHHQVARHYARAHRRGFTAFIRPAEDDPRKVLFSVAYCSKKDPFCKKIGRQVAEREVVAMLVNKRDVPKFLRMAELKCLYDHAEDDTYDLEWQYIYRYMM